MDTREYWSSLQSGIWGGGGVRGGTAILGWDKRWRGVFHPFLSKRVGVPLFSAYEKENIAS
jgi:hypothetical protein